MKEETSEPIDLSSIRDFEIEPSWVKGKQDSSSYKDVPRKQKGHSRQKTSKEKFRGNKRESNNFTDFFKVIPKKMSESNFGMVESNPNYILWVDNTSAISTAQDTDYKPKSRHYALRWHRVRDEGKNIFFVPTTLQKADGLTKLGCSVEQRNLLLATNFSSFLAIGGQVSNPCVYGPGEEDTDDELIGYTFATLHVI